MRISRFIQTGALGALAAALAFGAVPASAQDDHGHWRDRGQNAQPSGRTMTESRGQARQAGQQQVQPQQVQGQQGQRPQWQGRRQQGQQGQAQRQEWQGRQQQQQQQAQAQRQQWQGQQGRNRGYTDPNRTRDYGANRQFNNGYGARNNDGRYQNGNRYENRGYARNGANARQWNRGWRNDNRYDWQRYRATNRSIYRLGQYHSPYRGYSYRRFGVGSVLDQLFYGSSYWISDPWQYRLPEAYGPYRWVRYYDDALLVDTYTGEVVDTIYDFFW